MATKLRVLAFFIVVREADDGDGCNLLVGGCCNCVEEGESSVSNSDGKESSTSGSGYSLDGPDCGESGKGISTGDDSLGKDDGDRSASKPGCGSVMLVLIGLDSSVLSKNAIWELHVKFEYFLLEPVCPLIIFYVEYIRLSMISTHPLLWNLK